MLLSIVEDPLHPEAAHIAAQTIYTWHVWSGKDRQDPVQKFQQLCGLCSSEDTSAPHLVQVGDVLGALVGVGVLPLKEVATATLEAAVEEEGEDGQLVDGGSAWKLIGAVLQALAERTSQEEMAHQWQATGLELSAFFPSVSFLWHLHPTCIFQQPAVQRRCMPRLYAAIMFPVALLQCKAQM